VQTASAFVPGATSGNVTAMMAAATTWDPHIESLSGPGRDDCKCRLSVRESSAEEESFATTAVLSGLDGGDAHR
jgi:hypothetical protein